MFKLRLAILGPAIILMIAMGVLAVAVPNLLHPLMIGNVVIMVAALMIVILVERARRNRGS